MTDSRKATKPDNPLLNLAFNIILPVIILQQLGKRLGENGALVALGFALAIPLAYGIWDYLKRGHKNYISLLGLVNVGITGGFALLKLEGLWFAVKEAAFPAILGIGVAASSFSKRPFIQMMICNDQIMHLDQILAAIAAKGRESDFAHLCKRATLWLAGSFGISSALNLVLAMVIFTPISLDLPDSERAQILNEQIARMTGWGYVAIALPLMIFTGVVIYFFLKRLSQLTELNFDALMRAK